MVTMSEKFNPLCTSPISNRNVRYGSTHRTAPRRSAASLLRSTRGLLRWTAEIPLQILMYDVGRLPFESMENDRGEKCALQFQRSAIYFSNFDRVFVRLRCLYLEYSLL